MCLTSYDAGYVSAPLEHASHTVTGRESGVCGTEMLQALICGQTGLQVQVAEITHLSEITSGTTLDPIFVGFTVAT